jgi:hypothetical protein
MKRRALLGTLATLGATSAAAGCLESPGQSDDSTTAATTTTSTQPPPSSTEPGTSTTDDGDSTPAELLALGEPASAVDCPVPDEGRAVCHPEHADAALSLTPKPETVGLPAGETTLTLANDTDHEYRANFYGWTLSKRVDGDWYRIAPQYSPEPLHVLPSGATHEWTLAVDNSETPTGGAAAEADIDLAGLGGGEYAFTVSGWFPVNDDESFRVAAGARFALDGDPLELTPVGDPDTSRDDATVTVTSKEEPTEETPLSVLTVERVGEAGVPPSRPIRDRIVEQLLRPRMGVMGDPNPLRNALPFFEDGVDTVRYEAPSGVTPPFGLDERYYLGYDDEIYEITSERAE